MSVSRFIEEHFPDRYFLELIRRGLSDKKAICTRRWNWRKRRSFRRGDQRRALYRQQRL
ncbi:hypothetical protein ACLK19_01385 [Escherichia coli]